jgi:CDP-diacylglycerol--glycerol-3-phosphate 3-phosphatidyltransferase
MLNVLRAPLARVWTPLAEWLLRRGVTPDMVTVAGTVGTVAASLGLLATGHLFVGTLAIAALVLMDSLDGVMARARGGSTRFGAFLDSTLDRVADAAVFGALAWWLLRGADEPLLAALSLYCLVTAVVTSYAKARAEGLGMTCDVGVAERSERLVLVLVGAGFEGLGVPHVLPAMLWVLTVLTTVTVGQRVAEVRRQSGSLPSAAR